MQVPLAERPASGTNPHKSFIHDLIHKHRPNPSQYEELRAEIHSHPELSTQETATADRVVTHLRQLGQYQIHEKIGGHGVAAVLENGEGKAVLLRADMDALPVLEQTGLPYASKVTMEDTDGKVKPVMHACGHDVHVVCLLAAAEILLATKESWRGTLILVFQPSEERSGGAEGMVKAGLYDKVPLPDVVLGQHVMPLRAGKVGLREGALLTASDSLKITMVGRGGHASMPHATVDPVVMMASAIMKLQTIVSREVDISKDFAVVTVAGVSAGDAENVIPDTATFKVNVRTVDARVRDRVLEAIKRIVRAEADGSNAPAQPRIEQIARFPATVNVGPATTHVSTAFASFFGDSFDSDTPRVNGSEDFSVLATAIKKPYCFWLIGGIDPALWDKAEKNGTIDKDIPVNHSPFFGPVMQPTLQVGADALTVAAMSFLAV